MKGLLAASPDGGTVRLVGCSPASVRWSTVLTTFSLGSPTRGSRRSATLQAAAKGTTMHGARLRRLRRAARSARGGHRADRHSGPTRRARTASEITSRLLHGPLMTATTSCCARRLGALRAACPIDRAHQWRVLQCPQARRQSARLLLAGRVPHAGQRRIVQTPFTGIVQTPPRRWLSFRITGHGPIDRAHQWRVVKRPQAR